MKLKAAGSWIAAKKGGDESTSKRRLSSAWDVVFAVFAVSVSALLLTDGKSSLETARQQKLSHEPNQSRTGREETRAAKGETAAVRNSRSV